MLEQELDQQTFGQAQVLKSLRHGGIGVDKLGQDLRFHQVEIQEMFGQVTAGFFLPEQGRSQLFGFQDSGFNEALRQVHVSLTSTIFIQSSLFQSELNPNHRQLPGLGPGKEEAASGQERMGCTSGQTGSAARPI